MIGPCRLVAVRACVIDAIIPANYIVLRDDEFPGSEGGTTT